jgi:hypothetical protein
MVKSGSIFRYSFLKTKNCRTLLLKNDYNFFDKNASFLLLGLHEGPSGYRSLQPPKEKILHAKHEEKFFVGHLCLSGSEPIRNIDWYVASDNLSVISRYPGNQLRFAVFDKVLVPEILESFGRIWCFSSFKAFLRLGRF